MACVLYRERDRRVRWRVSCIESPTSSMACVLYRESDEFDGVCLVYRESDDFDGVCLV